MCVDELRQRLTEPRSVKFLVLCVPKNKRRAWATCENTRNVQVSSCREENAERCSCFYFILCLSRVNSNHPRGFRPVLGDMYRSDKETKRMSSFLCSYGSVKKCVGHIQK